MTFIALHTLLRGIEQHIPEYSCTYIPGILCCHFVLYLPVHFHISAVFTRNFNVFNIILCNDTNTFSIIMTSYISQEK